MSPRNLFQLEVASAAAHRGSLLVRLGLPLLLGLPLVLAGMPTAARVAGLVLLTLFLALFGAAVATVRRRTEGHREVLRLLPIPRALVVTDLLLAGVAVDLVQMGTVLVLFVAVHGRAVSAMGLVAAAGAFVAAVVVLNAAGMALASAMRNNPEVHLAGALAVGMIALLSGLVPVPERVAGVVEVLRPGNPVAAYAEALRAVAEGEPVAGTAWTAAAGAAAALAAAAVLVRGLHLWPRTVVESK